MHLSLALGDTDLNRGLADGTVRVEGCVPSVACVSDTRERQRRFLRAGEFDACELSLAAYLGARKQGGLTAIPVFPERRFCHRHCFVRTGAEIYGPKDLEGRRVGIDSRRSTLALWLCGILQHEYGVDLGAISWITGADLRVQDAPARCGTGKWGKDLEELLLAGEVGAILTRRAPPSLRWGDPRVARLFPDAKEEEQAYHRRSGIFPMTSVVAIRSEVVATNPWLPPNLMAAFERSRGLAYERLQGAQRTSLAWLELLVEEEAQLLGADPWPFGLTPRNRKALGAFVTYAWEQGLVDELVSVDELFCREAH